MYAHYAYTSIKPESDIDITCKLYIYKKKVQY